MKEIIKKIFNAIILLYIFVLSIYWSYKLFSALEWYWKLFGYFIIFVCLSAYINYIQEQKRLKEEAEERERMRKERERRLKEYEIYKKSIMDKYGEHYGQLIIDRKIEKGMTDEMVKEILGTPITIGYKDTKKTGRQEIWKYDEYRKGSYAKILKFQDGKLIELDIKR